MLEVTPIINRPKVAPEPPTPRNTLFGLYATDEEIAAVREAYEAIYISQTEVACVEDTIRVTNEQIEVAKRAQHDNIARAAALALGEPVPPPNYIGPSLSQLQMQKKGLEQRLAEWSGTVEGRKGRFRATVCELLRVCAERCAADYEEATRRQAWCHQQLANAQQLIGNARPVVDHITWTKYFVPGSPHIPALKQKSREEWGNLALMSADRLTLTTEGAMRELRAHGAELFGEWPL